MFTIDEYLRAKQVGSRHAGRAVSESTIGAYRTTLRLAERYVGKPLSEFTESDGDILMEQLAIDGKSAAYKGSFLAALRGAFTWAIATGRYQGSHPFAAISTPQIKRTLPIVLTKKQIEEFFKALRHRKYQLYFQLMYYGGLRSGEVAQLRKTDVYADGIVVRGKGDKQRFTYLPTSIIQRLHAFIIDHEDSDYVFYAETPNGRRDKPITLDHAMKLFHRAKNACGLPPSFHPHNLRHTSATHFHEKVGDLLMTQKFLGHSRPETTMIYAQITDARMKNAHADVFGD